MKHKLKKKKKKEYVFLSPEPHLLIVIVEFYAILSVKLFVQEFNETKAEVEMEI